MKSLTEHLWFEIPSRRGFENITATVEDLVRKSGVRDASNGTYNRRQRTPANLFELNEAKWHY